MYQADSPGQGRTTQFVITRHDVDALPMWQLGGFARRSPTLDRRPDRSPGAAAQGPEMSPEMPVARLCELPEPRPPRASRSPERAEVRHADAVSGVACGPVVVKSALVLLRLT